MKVVTALLVLSSVLISFSHSNLMQVLMSAISNTGKDPSTLISAAASQLVGEGEEEIKDNVGISFILNIKYTEIR